MTPAAITITNEQWAHGQESGVIWTTVDVVPEVECPDCSGQGIVTWARFATRPEDWSDCPTCNGTGTVPIVGRRVDVVVESIPQPGSLPVALTVGTALVAEALPIIDWLDDPPEGFLPWVVHYEDEPVDLRRFSTEGELVEIISGWLPFCDWTPGRWALRLEVEGT